MEATQNDRREQQRLFTAALRRQSAAPSPAHLGVIPAGRSADSTAPFERFLELVRLTDREHPAAAHVAELRALLTRASEIVAEIGGLAALVRERTLGRLGFSRLAMELAAADVERTKAELGYESAGSIERMLIDEAVCTRLDVMTLRLQRDHLMRTGFTEEQVIGRWGAWIEQAQGRLLRVVRELAAYRNMKSSRRPVQVHVGGESYLVAGSGIKAGRKDAGLEDQR